MGVKELLQQISSLDFTVIEIILLSLIGIGYGVFWIIKTIPDSIKKGFIKHYDERKENHNEATNYRKNIMPKIKKEFSYLAEITGVDRVMLFEFSNGSSNLVGLPFLNSTATVEILKSNISSVLNDFRKMNVLLFSEFLIELENKAYIYFKDIEEMKEIYPYIYSILKIQKVKSILFYAIYDEENSIGYIKVSSVTKTFERGDVLPKVAETAQIVSSLLNYNKLKEEIN